MDMHLVGFGIGLGIVIAVGFVFGIKTYGIGWIKNFFV